MLEIIPFQNEKVAYRIINGLAFLVSPEDSSLYMLNLTATRIWELSNGQNTIKSIADSICTEFDTDYETAFHDTEIFLKAFMEKQLLISSKG